MNEQQRAVLRQARDVLRGCLEHPDSEDAIVALTQALDAPEAEPVAWLVWRSVMHRTESGLGGSKRPELHMTPPNPSTIMMRDSVQPLYDTPQALPAPEPLTDDQIEDMRGDANRGFNIEREGYFKAVRDAEAAHGIAGGGK